MVAVLAQLVEHGAQEQRVAGLRRRRRARSRCSASSPLATAARNAVAQRSALVVVERRRPPAPASRDARAPRPTGAAPAVSTTPDVGGTSAGSQREVGCAVHVVEQVDAVDHHDRPCRPAAARLPRACCEQRSSAPRRRGSGVVDVGDRGRGQPPRRSGATSARQSAASAVAPRRGARRPRASGWPRRHASAQCGHRRRQRRARTCR